MNNNTVLDSSIKYSLIVQNITTKKIQKQDNLTQHILALLQVKLNTFLVAFLIVSL